MVETAVQRRHLPGKEEVRPEGSQSKAQSQDESEHGPCLEAGLLLEVPDRLSRMVEDSSRKGNLRTLSTWSRPVWRLKGHRSRTLFSRRVMGQIGVPGAFCKPLCGRPRNCRFRCTCSVD